MPDRQFVDALRTAVGAAAPDLFLGASPRVTLRLADATTTLSSSPSAGSGSLREGRSDGAGRPVSVLTGSGTVEILLAGPESSVLQARDVSIAVLTVEHDRLVAGAASEVAEGAYDVAQRYTALSLASVTTHVEPADVGTASGSPASCRLTLRVQIRIEIRRAVHAIPDVEDATRQPAPAGVTPGGGPAEPAAVPR